MFTGQVRLCDGEIPLGYVRVELRTTKDGWGGIIGGSDYLMWGANHRVMTIEFGDGEAAEVVVRATGRLLGRGPRPSVLRPAAEPDVG